VHQGTRATNRHGAEAARGAHNSEVTRSKRVAGIFIDMYMYVYISLTHSLTNIICLFI
jgi:hypothetical protein